MTFQSNYLPRQGYFVFRFEDSLRKYEPQPRKKVKLSQQQCQHCIKKKISLSKQSRISILCATRKRYNRQSRDKASSFSKMKQNYQSKNIYVSSFMEDQPAQSLDDGKKQQQFKSQINNKNAQLQQKEEKMDGDDIINNIFADIKIRQTPLKQQIQEQLLQNQKNIQKQIMQSQERRQNQIKDIDFHIKRVAQLHQKIFNSDEDSVSQFNNQIVDINNFQVQYSLEKQQSQQFQEMSHNFQYQNRLHSQINQQIVKLAQQQHHQVLQQQIYTHSQQKHDGKMKSKQHKNKRLKQFIQNHSNCSVSRISIQTRNGLVSFSTRILAKFVLYCMENSENIPKKIAKRYPKLASEDIHKIQNQITYKINQQMAGISQTQQNYQQKK